MTDAAVKSSLLHQKTLSESVTQALTCYFSQLENGMPPTALYAMVMEEVERPLLEVVNQQAQGNQVQMAKILGISRSTLRNKLKKYELLDEPQ